MSERDDILAANAAFYRAFAGRDIAAMNALWAARAPVSCLHPGWAPLIGRAAVLASWTAILENPSQPKIEFADAEARLIGGVGFVICMEEVMGSRLIATNCFVQEESAWRMVHHQSGPTAAPPRPARRSGGTVH
ncbi:MAG: nuclear transport factor 2 family protein [Rhodospirillales bacterium]